MAIFNSYVSLPEGIPQCEMEKWIEIYKSSNFPPSQTVSGWWFGTMEFYDFPNILGDCHHPN